MHKRHHVRWPWLAAFVSLAIVLTGAIATGASAGKSESGICASIDRLNVEKQMNARAGEILAACGRASSRTPEGAIFSALSSLTSSPNDYGGTDVNVVTGGEGASPKVTQSEVQVWSQGNTVVAAYNDSRTSPSCYSGGSYSTNGGANWTNLNARPFCAGHGTSYGDPVVYYDIEHSKWVAIFLASGCGGQGIGVWFSTDGITWTVGPCAHSGGSDDRESGWVDNNPASPFYGDQYVSWNNFAIGGGALYVIKSTDGGLTWGAPVQLNAAFIRNVQITTGPNGYVYVASMDEGGGGLGNRHEQDLPLDRRRCDLDLDHDRRGLPRPGSFDLRLLRRHVSLLLATHGLGRHPEPGPRTACTTSTPSTARARTRATSTTSARPTTAPPGVRRCGSTRTAARAASGSPHSG